MRIFPWTSRTKRRQAVEAAQEQAEESRKSAEKAKHITRDLERMVEDNHFTDAIHFAITGKRISHLNGGR